MPVGHIFVNLNEVFILLISPLVLFNIYLGIFKENVLTHFCKNNFYSQTFLHHCDIETISTSQHLNSV